MYLIAIRFLSANEKNHPRLCVHIGTLNYTFIMLEPFLASKTDNRTTAKIMAFGTLCTRPNRLLKG